MTILLPLLKPTYAQSFMLIYCFLLVLWVSNLNEEEKEKKIKNSAHHIAQYIYDGEDLVLPIYKALPCFVIGRGPYYMFVRLCYAVYIQLLSQHNKLTVANSPIPSAESRRPWWLSTLPQHVGSKHTYKRE